MGNTSYTDDSGDRQIKVPQKQPHTCSEDVRLMRRPLDGGSFLTRRVSKPKALGVTLMKTPPSPEKQRVNEFQLAATCSAVHASEIKRQEGTLEGNAGACTELGWKSGEICCQSFTFRPFYTPHLAAQQSRMSQRVLLSAQCLVFSWTLTSVH